MGQREHRQQHLSMLNRRGLGFGYISGKPSDRMLNDIYETMTSGHSERRLVLITADDEVTAFFRDKDVQMDLRAEYTYHPQAASIVPAPTRFHIEKINLANISRIQGRIIPSFSWDSPERFLKDGFGYIALDQERVCAVAFSAAVSSDQKTVCVIPLSKQERPQHGPTQYPTKAP